MRFFFFGLSIAKYRLLAMACFFLLSQFFSLKYIIKFSPPIRHKHLIEVDFSEHLCAPRGITVYRV